MPFALSLSKGIPHEINIFSQTWPNRLTPFGSKKWTI
jgi:hypothetical protein